MPHKTLEERRRYQHEYNLRPEVREKDRQRGRVHTRTWESEGLCRRCGGENLTEYKTCEACRVRARKSKKIKRDKRHNIGQ